MSLFDLLAVMPDDDALDSVKAFVESGYDLNTRDDQGRTMLIFSVIAGKSRTIAYLLRAGTDVNLVDVHRKSALSYAKEKGGQIVQVLLLAGSREENL